VNKYLKFFLLLIAVWFDIAGAFGRESVFRHSSLSLNYWGKTWTADGTSNASKYNATNVKFSDLSGSFSVNIESKAAILPVTVAPPKITYTTPNVYPTNTVITPLAPKNTGGAVPATIYGKVSTFVGTGNTAVFYNPTRLAQDASGNLYVADRDNNQIKKVTPAGVVTLFASGFNQPNGVAVDKTGNVYVADAASNQIKKITPAGVVSVFAGSGSAGSQNGPAGVASFYYPYSLVFDAAGNLYTTDSQNSLIRKIAPDGTVSTFAGSDAGFADGQGTAAKFNIPSGLNIDAAGNIYVADANNSRVRKITPTGLVTTVSGTGAFGADNGPALSATFNVPAGVVVDDAGNIYVADIRNNLIRKIDPQGIVTTLAGNGSAGSDDGVGVLASFNHPNDVQYNTAGFIYVTDYGNSMIRKVIVTGYTIDKALPPGLSFDPTTGIISGTPTVAWPATDYLVTGYNTGGSSSFIVNIKVADLVPVITAGAVSGSIVACQGSVSSLQQFVASGKTLSQTITVTAPGGFLVSASATTGFANKIFLALQGNTVNSTNLFVKIADNTNAGVYSGNVVLTSAGATGINVPVNATVNALPVMQPVAGQDICNGDKTMAVVFTGTASSYSWTNDNPSIGLASSGVGNIGQFITQNGTNIVQTAKVTVTPSSGTCPGVPVIFSIVVNPAVVASASISQAQVNCPGQPVSFNAVPNNAGITPAYTWRVNGQAAGTNSATFSSTALNSGDAITCVITGSDRCAVPATSNTLNVKFIQPVIPSVTIDMAGPVSVCTGNNVTLTAVAINEGTNPTYQWMVNGQMVNNTGKIYKSSALITGDKVTCVVINNDGCVPSSSAVSAPASIVVIPNQLIAISINQQAVICKGQPVTFVATPQNAGNSPVYQWLVNGQAAGNNSALFISNILNSGDVVTCVVAGSDHCNAPATSNAVSTSFKATGPTPTVSIDLPGPIKSCAGDVITLTAIAVNGGNNPTYQWMVNGQAINNAGKVYNSSILVTGDNVTCTVTNNDGCVPLVSPASLAVGIIATPVPALSVSISQVAVNCIGQPVDFTAVPNNTSIGISYQWMVNSQAVGNNSAAFSSSSLNANDAVSCIVSSTAQCSIPVKSNIVGVSYTPVITPTVSIDMAGVVDGCVGSEIALTAMPVNAGNNPTYQWMLNGQQVNNNGNKYTSSTLVTGDKITCSVTNNDGCSPVTSTISAPVNIIITPIQVSTVTISTSVTMPVCQGRQVTFTPTPANYQLDASPPTYAWYLNGTVVSSSGTYTTKTLADGDQVYCVMTAYGKCTAPTPAQSNVISINLAPEIGCIIVPIAIPNAFTPNGDGNNDTWNIPALANYPDCIVTVFNRYGISLFNSVGYVKAWNGRYNGNDLPVGTYYYIIDPKNGQAKLSGYVLIIR
jgi:gliding motility-associated-like protein